MLAYRHSSLFLPPKETTLDKTKKRTMKGMLKTLPLCNAASQTTVTRALTNGAFLVSAEETFSWKKKGNECWIKRKDENSRKMLGL